MAEMTLETLMSELAKLNKIDSPDGWMTMNEIIDATGKSRATVAYGVRDLCRAGKMECRKVSRPSISGVNQMVPGYRFTPTTGGKNGKGKKAG